MVASTADRGLPAAALGAAAATAVALTAAGIYAYKAPKEDESYHFIVFVDSPAGCSRNGKFIIVPKSQASLLQLEAAACSALCIQHASLFLMDTKEQLLQEFLHQQLDQHLANSSGWRGCTVLPLIASESGQLSSDAAQLSPIKLPPCGPRPLPIVRNALLATSGPYDPPFYNFWHHLFTPDKVEKWGETVRIELPVNPQDRQALQGHYDDYDAAICSNIHTCDPDVLQELLERQDDFPKCWNRSAERAVTRLAENGIFSSSTPSTDWQTIHGLFPRGFNQLKIQNAYFPIIVNKTGSFVAEWGRYEPGHLITGVNNWLACMTADAVIKASCNVDMDNIARRARGEPAHPVLETFRKLGAINPATAKPWQVVGLWSYLNPLYDTQAGRERTFNELKRQLQGMVEELVEQTRRGEMGDTLLSSLINDRSPTNGLYVRQSLLFSHFVTLLVAGHETTANTMGFLMYYLSQNPEWEQRLRAEIREVLGGRSELAASDIPRLVVSEACFKEALRLHPPAGNVGRDAAHDTVIKGQYLLRRGQRISINLVAMHRQARHWGGKFGDPNTFNPTRFLPGAAEACGRHPHAFKPFGFGVRACVGMQFAMWEAKTLIPMLYHHFTFKLVENFTLRPSRKESFPSPSAQGLAFYIYPAPAAPAAAPAVTKPISAPAKGSADADTAAADTAAPGTPMHTSSNGARPPAAVSAGEADSTAHNTPLLVLYGSNSGTCEAFAAQLVLSAAAACFRAKAATLDSVMSAAGSAAGSGQPQLPKSGAVLVVTSTYNGEPPDNALRFAKWLPAAEDSTAAQGLLFSVLGVGNSQWVTYQVFPRLVDRCLAAAGGVRLAAVAEADTEAPGFADAAGEYWVRLCPLLLQHFQVDAPNNGSTPPAGNAPRLQLEPASSGTLALTIKDVLDTLKTNAQPHTQVADAVAAQGSNAAVVAAAATEHVFPYDRLKVVGSEELQAPGSGRFTRHVELQLPEHMSYTAGDHLEVLPRNHPALVDSALQLLHLNGEEVFWWTPNTQGAGRGLRSLQPASGSYSSEGSNNSSVSSSGGGCADSSKTLRLPLCSRDVLAWLVDLSAVPPMRLVALLAAACPCPPEAAQLQRMATEEVFKEKVLDKQLTLLELLASHRSLLAGSLDLPGLAALLPRLAPRYYSVSSSPAAPGGPHRVTITVALVEHTTPTGRVHMGAASSLIHRQQVGLYLAGTVRRLQSRFRLPPNPATPIIMVGPGTGIAPMVGFLEEREAQHKAGTCLGPAVLFFGCRSEQDLLYRHQLQAWQASGVLTDLQVAFSRQPGADRVYVQDLIAASAQQLWQLLRGQGAHVYVCGDARKMAPDVRAAFEGIARAAGGLDAAAAAEWLQGMRKQGVYLEDVWAS